ncbi:ABC transporter permease [Ferrimonas pelagia]|uniref:ABC transporter permease n=1 Tax=Ferrimonas pelagia TaxID=1177826 RepID=A0ABP9F5T4_9GAMM
MLKFDLRAPTTLLGVFLLFALLILVLFEQLAHGVDGTVQLLDNAFALPSWQEPLGTDQFGRSNLARLSAAIQISLWMSLLCVITAATLGTVAGIAAAWLRGWVDASIGFVVNVLMALPGLILVLLIGALFPGSFTALYIAISLVLWVEFFRVVRAQTLSLLASPEIEASRLYGFGPLYLFRRHLLPRLLPSLLPLACFGAGNAILALASIGFVYVGLQPPRAELGLMMVELFPYYSDAPWVLAQPVLCVFALILSFNLIAGGFRHDH